MSSKYLKKMFWNFILSQLKMKYHHNFYVAFMTKFFFRFLLFDVKFLHKASAATAKNDFVVLIIIK